MSRRMRGRYEEGKREGERKGDGRESSVMAVMA